MLSVGEGVGLSNPRRDPARKTKAEQGMTAKAETRDKVSRSSVTAQQEVRRRGTRGTVVAVVVEMLTVGEGGGLSNPRRGPARKTKAEQGVTAKAETRLQEVRRRGTPNTAARGLCSLWPSVTLFSDRSVRRLERRPNPLSVGEDTSDEFDLPLYEDGKQVDRLLDEMVEEGSGGTNGGSGRITEIGDHLPEIGRRRSFDGAAP
ncbi:hypothetical protein PIB30_074191 [Stylosanthes scabra]|uniref:Uncharacterized protein n=1 Tax=Stylosanthes scabra TaxID=79078 RepID=A0ABU6WPG3_9FABA|nr:hypothetical protein [Stylosanthes scabra]